MSRGDATFEARLWRNALLGWIFLIGSLIGLGKAVIGRVFR